MWRVMQNRMSTKDNLSKRGIQLDSEERLCCVSHPENADHLFTRCSSAKEVGAHIHQWWSCWPVDAVSVRGMWDVTMNLSCLDCSKQVASAILTAYFCFIILY